MKRSAVFQLLHRGTPLAARLPTPDLECHSWLGVYPLDPARPDTGFVLRRFGVSFPVPKAFVYRVRTLKVPRKLVEAEICFGEDELIPLSDSIVIGDDALDAKLAELGVEAASLVWPSDADYPI